jgi:hypothetical protein
MYSLSVVLDCVSMVRQVSVRDLYLRSKSVIFSAE